VNCSAPAVTPAAEQEGEAAKRCGALEKKMRTRIRFSGVLDVQGHASPQEVIAWIESRLKDFHGTSRVEEVVASPEEAAPTRAD